MAHRNYFRDEMTDWPTCEYCAGHIQSQVKAKTLSSSLNSFLELKALYKCWDLLAAPMLNYLSQEITMSSGMVRYLLKALVSIEDPRRARQIQTLLEQQAALHPPCRPGMQTFYSSVLFEPIHNLNFDHSITENFFDFMKRIETSESSVAEKTKSTSVVVNTHTDAVAFLKRSLKPVSPKTTVNWPKEFLNYQIFVFNFCVDILSHDFMVNSRNGSELKKSMLYKMVWGTFADDIDINLHVKDVFRLYANVAPDHRRDVGKYLVLLAECFRLHDVTEESQFPFFGIEKEDKCDDFVAALAARLRENGTVTFNTIDLIRDIPSNWLRCQLSVHMLCTQLFSNTRNSGRKKKYFAIFK
uniref:Uncharacterized protein n=1 Tax=Lygus hesperus TaxID=30085 RepID=A0A146LJ79_LYGHE